MLLFFVFCFSVQFTSGGDPWAGWQQEKGSKRTPFDRFCPPHFRLSSCHQSSIKPNVGLHMDVNALLYAALLSAVKLPALKRERERERGSK